MRYLAAAAGFATALMLASARRAAGQSQTVGCGDTVGVSEDLQSLKPRFLSTAPLYVRYRTANQIQQLDSTAVMEAVTDPTVCNGLATRLHDQMLAWKNWEIYWSKVQWKEHYFRFGPYYVVQVTETVPPDVIGGAWALELFHVDSLEPITLRMEIID